MRALACLAAALLYTAGAVAAWADPWTIRIGWVTAPTHLQPVIDALQKKHPELFPQFGKTYVAEGVHYQGTTPQIQSLAINELEIASFAPDSLAFAVNNAHLDVRMVADVFQDSVPGWGTATFVVQKNGPIHRIEELRGKTVATNAIGSYGDGVMRIMLRKHGLEDRDFTTVEAPFPAMPPMLDEDKVQLINLVPQFHYLLPKYRLLFTGAQSEGRVQAVLWAMRADVIAAHRAALVDFFEDHLRAVQWLINPAHHAEAVALAAAATKQKPETLDFFMTKLDQYRAPDGRPDVAATQRAIDIENQYGVIRETLKVAPRYVDLGPIEEAEKRLRGS